MKTIPVCDILVTCERGVYHHFAVAKSLNPEDVDVRAVNRLAKKFAKAKKDRFIFADFSLERMPIAMAHQATKDYAANMFRKVFKTPKGK